MRPSEALDQSVQRLSHQDFVSEVRRTGLIPVTVETFLAYQFAASYRNSPPTATN